MPVSYLAGMTSSACCSSLLCSHACRWSRSTCSSLHACLVSHAGVSGCVACWRQHRHTVLTRRIRHRPRWRRSMSRMRAFCDSMALLAVGTLVTAPSSGSMKVNMVRFRMCRRMVSRALTSRWCRSFSLPSGGLVAWVPAEYGADVWADVEQAALHAGVGPRVSEELADAAAPSHTTATGSAMRAIRLTMPTSVPAVSPSEVSRYPSPSSNASGSSTTGQECHTIRLSGHKVIA